MKNFISISFVLALLVASCNQTDTESQAKQEEVYELPCVSDFFESESNDTFEQADWVGILTTEGTHYSICARTSTSDTDAYWFAVHGLWGVSHMPTSFVIEGHPDTWVTLSLYHTVYDELGEVAGYNWLLSHVGASGELAILDYPIDIGLTDDSPPIWDLIVVVESNNPLPNEDYPYKLEVWSD